MFDVQTPCFILDKNEFLKSVRSFRSALEAQFPRSILGISVKTNSLPYLLKLAKEEGCYAEVVSYDEYELALACGFEKRCIIYNGPLKSKSTFIEAVKHGAIVNIETKRELKWLLDLPKDGRYNIGLRLNIDFINLSLDDEAGKNTDSRFGFSFEDGEFSEAVEFIRALPHVCLCGVHIHRTFKTRQPVYYTRLVRYAMDVLRKCDLRISYLDVGGGYFGIFSDKPSYQDYAQAIKLGLDVSVFRDSPFIIVEPGNGITASVFSFVAEVIDKKEVGGRTFLTLDGSRNDVDPLFRKDSYLYEILRSEERQSTPPVPIQTLVGCTCLEFDRFFDLNHHQPLFVGDRIRFDNVGAYTMCLTPLFIRMLPRVYLKEGDKVTKIVRYEWTAQEILIKSDLS